jgi:transposase-like protein
MWAGTHHANAASIAPPSCPKVCDRAAAKIGPRRSHSSIQRLEIVVAVRWYLRYGLSYRDVEELLAERGIEVDHVTIYRWVQRFTRC